MGSRQYSAAENKEINDFARAYVNEPITDGVADALYEAILKINLTENQPQRPKTGIYSTFFQRRKRFAANAQPITEKKVVGKAMSFCDHVAAVKEEYQALKKEKAELEVRLAKVEEENKLLVEKFRALTTIRQAVEEYQHKF